MLSKLCTERTVENYSECAGKYQARFLLILISITGELLGHAIAENSGIKSLNLAWNCIRGRGAVAVAKGLGVQISALHRGMWNNIVLFDHFSKHFESTVHEFFLVSKLFCVYKLIKYIT